MIEIIDDTEKPLVRKHYPRAGNIYRIPNNEIDDSYDYFIYTDCRDLVDLETGETYSDLSEFRLLEENLVKAKLVIA